MICKVEGVVARQILLNYWLEPEVARRLVPEPFEIVIRNGFAVAGINLLRLEGVRPAGATDALGLCSENLAHRIAVRYPVEENGAPALRDGTYILRRDTDSALAGRLGELLLPGTVRDAEFRVAETAHSLRMAVLTADGGGDLAFRCRWNEEWKWTLLFSRLNDVRSFCARTQCGCNSALRADALEAPHVLPQEWEVAPATITDLHASYFADEKLFPRGSVGFDSAIMLRGVPQAWRALRAVPEMADRI